VTAVEPRELHGARLRILAVPAPQGSKRAFVDRAGNARMDDSGGAALRSWRAAVTEEAARAREDLGRALIPPVSVEVTFRWTMPAARPKAIRDRGYARKSTKPDVDKVVRSLLDGLAAAGLIADDSHVSDLRARKIEVAPGQWTGAEATVWEVAP
jgi:Holliday junction resolvase RusA-like endonuclease